MYSSGPCTATLQTGIAVCGAGLHVHTASASPSLPGLRWQPSTSCWLCANRYASVCTIGTTQGLSIPMRFPINAMCPWHWVEAVYVRIRMLKLGSLADKPSSITHLQESPFAPLLMCPIILSSALRSYTSNPPERVLLLASRRSVESPIAINASILGDFSFPLGRSLQDMGPGKRDTTSFQDAQSTRRHRLEHIRPTAPESNKSRSTAAGHRSSPISRIPDDALLEIFDNWRMMHRHNQQPSHRDWHKLTQVCRRWRFIIHSAPLRFRLRFICSLGTHVEDTLAHSPPWPITVDYVTRRWSKLDYRDECDLIYALQYQDRVCELSLKLEASQLIELVTAMTGLYPALEHLTLQSYPSTSGTVPDSFLGESTPKLRSLSLTDIALPKLPSFISSATCLSHLYLQRINRCSSSQHP
ncbi:hypothetical protein BC834DRAFT_281608 [Gloeopeniophorella convolvens]|nr:hypothetical protein BC834DRAFT_281608 [Gloeopeniophorella convolvens]